MLNILKDPKKISHIFSTVWIPIFDKGKGVISSPQYGYRYLIKVKTGVIYLFHFIMPVSVTCYSIIMDVALVIEAAE